ncbi:MAG: M20 family metallopeptidase, partial [Candidatus Bathyarchaeota archaeon]|nr:M20 family metallopeptidase [Candidatus Bathyarchaeota archaeon]
DSVGKVVQEAERNEAEVVKLCSELVKIPSVNPPGITEDVVEYVESYFDGIGVKSEMYERKEGKQNICVRLVGNKAGKVLWLGHLDVVPEGDRNLWSHDPFGGELVGRRVYGRGASDMKGSCASAMMAVSLLSNMDQDDYCTVEFWFTCDEETGATDGVAWLSGSGKLSGDICVIGDGSSAHPEYPAIDIGCKGYIRPTLKVEGLAAHGSQPFMGENAIDNLIRMIDAVKKVEEMRLDIPEALEPAVSSSIEIFKRARELSEKQIAGLKRVFHYPTASLNLIGGGIKVNIVPDKAEATFDVRVTPGTDLAAVKERIARLVEESGIEGGHIEILNHKEGYYEEPSSHAVREASRAVEAATTLSPRQKILTGGTDAIPLRTYVDIPCVGFGVGLQGMSHVHNEYVTSENLVLGTKVYAVFPLLYQVG